MGALFGVAVSAITALLAWVTGKQTFTSSSPAAPKNAPQSYPETPSAGLTNANETGSDALATKLAPKTTPIAPRERSGATTDQAWSGFVDYNTPPRLVGDALAIPAGPEQGLSERDAVPDAQSVGVLPWTGAGSGQIVE